jgi:hypothetical protein
MLKHLGCHLRPVLMTVLLVTMLPTNPAFAAFDWLQKGRELLNGTTATNSGPTLSNQEIGLGLKDALRVSSERVVGQLGALDGFNADPKIHIPLPDSLDRARTLLTTIGYGALFDDLELKLNRAAEAATPEARALFWSAIEQLTLEDVQAIYQGPDDAATRYFRDKMSAPLSQKMQPIVAQSLAEVGAINAYDAAMEKYRNLPFVPDVKSDLTGYVIEKGLDGIFFYLAEEEAAIRNNPAKRTTELLQKVFGKP